MTTRLKSWSRGGGVAERKEGTEHVPASSENKVKPRRRKGGKRRKKELLIRETVNQGEEGKE